MKLVVLLVGALAATSLDCHPDVEQLHPHDAPSGSCTAPCARLKAFDCPEGADASACVRGCSATRDTSLGSVVDWDCVEKAKSVDAVRQCGHGPKLCAPR